MAEEVPTVNLDDTRSQAASTYVAESDRDSLNSLLNKPKDNKNCLKDCTLGTQYSMTCDEIRKDTKKRSFCCSTTSQTVWGVILISLSICGFIYTPQDLMLQEKLNMRPGLPPFDWWSDPPDQVRMRMYVFNVTNHDRFLSGADDKINVEEIGPIVYLEKLLHYNITFNENGTMTYTAKRFLIYLPEENTINLNSTIIVPNLAVLGIASRIHNDNFLIRGAFSLMVRTHSAELFAKKTIYQFMWDNQESVLETTKLLAHHMVPTTNMGVLFSIYTDFTDDVTVRIGPEWGNHNFFKIDRYGQKSQLKGYDLNTCPETLIGSTEGVMYHQRLSKDDVLLYLRKSVCRAMPLSFDQEVTIDNVPVYRYNLSEHAFDRINGTDCYDSKPSLPNGVSDTSKCYDGLPMVASYPHFYTGHPRKDTYVTGLTPDKERHNSYVLVEPLTGTPFRAVARMQCNIQVQNLSAFSDPNFHKFSNLIIPLSWIEYSQEGLPWYIKYFIYFLVVILPPLSTLLLTGTLILGLYFVLKQIYRKKCVRRKLVTKVFETEKFLKVTN